MSRIVPRGVVGPRYWMYMATVMASYLGAALDAKRIADIPKGVYREALRFFGLVLRSTDEAKLPENFPASIHAAAIAAEALVESSSSVPPNSIEELDSRFEKFEDFLKGIDEQRNLSEDDLKTASELKKFFQRLVYAGEMEKSNSLADVRSRSINYASYGV